MKTITDLLYLALTEVKLSQGMSVKYHFSYNSYYNWFSFFKTYPDPDEDYKDKITEKILSHVGVESPELIQFAYYSVITNGRTGSLKNVPCIVQHNLKGWYNPDTDNNEKVILVSELNDNQKSLLGL